MRDFRGIDSAHPPDRSGSAVAMAERLRDAFGRISIDPPETFNRASPLVAVVSSHLGHDRGLQSEVFRRLASRVMECRRREETVLVVAGTSIADLVLRAASLFRVPTLCLHLPQDDAGLGSLPSRGPLVTVDGASGESVCRDRLSILIPDRVEALFVRRGGKIERCLRERLGLVRDASTRVAVCGHRRCGAAGLIRAGAVGRFDPSSSRVTRRTTMEIEPGRSAPAAARTVSPKPTPSWMCEPDSWLVHCTRAATSATPGLTPAQQLDSLLLSADAEAATPFATLARIARGGRLLASATATARDQPVVCFSALPLAELLARRCYRSHLHRWDYEPYGVAIRRRAAIAEGIRPVIYGDPTTRGRLPAAERYLFQPHGDSFDWTQEREWRSRRTVELSRFDPQDVRLFVPTIAEATRLTRLCRWAIDVVPQEVLRSARFEPPGVVRERRQAPVLDRLGGQYTGGNAARGLNTLPLALPSIEHGDPSHRRHPLRSAASAGALQEA